MPLSETNGSVVAVTHPDEQSISKKRKVGPALYDFDQSTYRSTRRNTPPGLLQAAQSVPSHPLRVKPLGNAWDAKTNIRSLCGSFSKLPDELLLALLEYLPCRELVAVGTTNKALYAFSRSEDLWKNLFLENAPASDFEWRGTWRDTVLQLSPENKASVQCPGLFSDVLYRPWQCANLDLASHVSNIPRRNAIARLPDLTSHEYNSQWADKPFILTEPVKHWQAYKDWSIEHLFSKYSGTSFRAEAVDWKFNTYVSYMRNNTDESPLYLFDCQFDQKIGVSSHKSSALASATPPAYTPPSTFDPDLFELLAPHRPDHAWLIIGPARSGSTFHCDPNGTSAWNAVLRGAKYWLMFPPPTPPSHSGIPGVHLSEDLSHITSPLSLSEYLLTFHGEARRTPGCVEGICRDGEILHVPAGWYHMVVNLEEGVALTQNFVSKASLPGCLAFLRDRKDQVSGFHWRENDELDGSVKVEADAKVYGEGAEYELFVARLREKYPDLLDGALEELEKRDKQMLKSGKPGQPKARSRWSTITENIEASKGSGTAQTNGFSFGFDDEENSDGNDSED